MYSSDILSFVLAWCERIDGGHRVLQQRLKKWYGQISVEIQFPLSFFLCNYREDFINRRKRIPKKYLSSNLSIGVIKSHEERHDVFKLITRFDILDSSTSTSTASAKFVQFFP